jgi:hypothetical protein
MKAYFGCAFFLMLVAIATGQGPPEASAEPRVS